MIEYLIIGGLVVIGIRRDIKKDKLRHRQTLAEIDRIEDENKYLDMRIATLTRKEPPWPLK